MKSFMLLLAFGLVSTEKLDRTYLPPPGSKYAGGDAGDLQAPLEYTKQDYTTVSPFGPGQKDRPTSEDTRLTVGIDRGTGLPRLPENNAVTPRNQSPVTYNLPTTTTSYAFTQTTTFPPPEGFETTVSPLPGILPDGSLNIPSAPGTFPQGQEQIFNQQIGGQNQPGYAPGRPSPTPGFNIPGSLSALPGQIIPDDRQSYTQNQGFSQYPQNVPSSTISPVSHNLPGQTYGPQGQHLGVQPPLNQQGTFPGSTVAPNYQTNIPSQFGNFQGSTSAPFVQPGQYSQQVTEQQFPFSPTSQPIQYVDKFGNVQTITVPDPQNPELGGQRPLFAGQQGPPSQSGSQFSNQGTITPDAAFPTQSIQLPQHIGQQLFPTPGSQGLVTISPTSRPGQQGQQTIGQQGVFPSTPELLVPVQGGQQYQIPGQLSSFASTGVPQPTPGSVIITQPGQQPQLIGQPGSTPSTITPQGYPSTFQPGTQVSGIPGSNIPHSSYPGQQYQNLPGTQFLNQQSLGPNGQPQYPIGLNSSQLFPTPRPGQANSVYQPGLPGFNQPSFPSSTLAALPAYGTTPESIIPSPSSAYPGSYQGSPSSYNNLRPERPQADVDRNAVILNYKNEITPEGFAYSFDTSNGIHADENGTATDGVKAEGSYSYIGDDGNVYNVVYSADENGFRPHGAHLPTPPPVPEAIQRVIEQAAKDREAGIVHDGSYDDTKYGHKKYQGPHRHPQLKDKIVTNGASIPDDDESKFDDAKNIKTLERKDNIKPIVSPGDDSEEDYDDGVRNSEDKTTSKSNQKRPSGKVSSRRPSDRGPEIDGYESVEDDDYTQLNSNQRPSGSKTGYKNKYIPERKDSLRRPGSSNRGRKPGYSGEKLDGSQKVDEEALDESEQFDDDNASIDRIPTKKPGTKYTGSKKSSQDLPRRYNTKTNTENRRPQDNRKSSAYNSRYENEPDELYTQKFDENGRPTKPSKYPVKSYTTKYSVSGDSDEEYDKESDKPGQKPIRRPQGSYQHDLTDNRYKQTDQRRPGTIQREEDYKFNKPNKSGIVTSNQESSYKQENVSNKYPQQPIDDETGYQYTPPQNKFDQRVIQKFPTRISGAMKYDITEKKTTVRPFMTPNVYQDEDKSYEEESNEQISSERPGQTKTKSKAPTKVDYETTYDGPEFFDKDIDSELDIGDDEIASTRVYPEQPGLVSSTRRLSYHTQKISKPEYSDRFTPSGQYIKQQGYKPDQEYTQQNTGTTRRPGYVSSSTSMPSRRPTYDSKKRPQDYTQREGHINYQTTYEPSSTPNYENDYSQRNRRPGFSSTSATRKPSTKIGSYPDSTTPSSFGTETGVSRIPSSRPTSRPIYDDGTTITDFTTSEGIFGKPSSQPGEYSTNQPSRPTSAPDGYYYDKPSSTVSSLGTNYPDRIMSTSVTLKPGSTRIPGQTETTQSLPSTTYRPNYSITDITRPGSVKVDTFGRPISGQPDQVVGNIRPGFTETSQQGQSLPGTTTVDAYGRPVNQLVYPGQSGANTGSLENQYPPDTVRIDTLGRPINQYGKVINNTSHPGYTVTSGQGQNQPGSVAFDAFGRPVNQFTQPGFSAIPGSVQNEPGVNVDKFGQPVSNLGQPGQVTGSSQPDYNGRVVGSTIRPGLAFTQDTGLPTTSIYKNSGVNIPGQSKDTFKPSEAFGSTTPGPRPAEFGPSNVRTPAYLGPYPSTTERVKGEDFSGPKQPQRFDPNTGYHY